jgi:hypothetical protein
MIQSINRKTLESMRDGVKDGVGSAWKQVRRVEFRTPWIYKAPIAGPKPWFLGLAILGSVLAVIGGILYFRKRKQVADRYTMGEPDAAASYEPSEYQNSENLTAAGR